MIVAVSSQNFFLLSDRIDHFATGSPWRRTPCPRAARLLRHPLEAKLVVPPPSPAVIFERLSLMRAVVSLPQMVTLLPLPLLSSLKAVEWRWRERGQVTHRRLDEQRQVETALRGRQAFGGDEQSRR